MNLTIGSFLVFTALVGLLTWFLTRKDDHGSSVGYFLGGRSLAFPFIAGSLLLTNLSTEQLVGLNGAAFKHGLHVMVWEVGAVITLVMMALYFLPKFLRSGVATVPQYLGIRYDGQVRAIVDAVFLLAYALILLPIVLYSGAKGLASMLDLSALTGIESESGVIWFVVILIGVIGSVYALFGGLRTVAVSDTLNGAGLLVGGMLITYFGLQAVGDGAGVMKGVEILKSADPERFNSIGGPKAEVPFSTIFTGVMLLNLFYWCTNQQIIQRTFGASSLSEGQKGVLLTGGLKLLGPLYLVIPGMIAYHLYASSGVKADDAYGHLVKSVLPPHLTGFFAAVMVGAILSSFNSALNSTCTIFSLGFYKGMINKEASERQVVASGRWFGLGIAVVSVLIAPQLLGQDSLFGYLQKMNAIYFIPLFAVIIVGMTTKRVPALAAKVGMAVGFALFFIGYFVPVGTKLNDSGEEVARYMSGDWMNGFHFIGLVFAIIVVIMLVISLFKGRDTDFVQEDVKAVDMTPWKHGKLVGAILTVIVVIIYGVFADFSVL
ncbi:solute:sodium symporter family transporter [Verrucomicrobiaceae bacterium R5-34]|uniref:Solute:sodium symporter family transporter n=1 Tax=Oceaniferula flava TaxID=2800421 RepID=A0AAE2S967_9BACT|nr:solute:sodium symporter family transporter [Oceaniferula flavus]MBK1829323.1 solute:sodium symporter family transporter [Verrucomicrobiaceae bacterium R5-34]MBK1853550.1 solute:sodium symporter family transporter [Oceaniferula flavus]MBM1134855.1 solute:sodium symporter family transporter [Oceaniferula flavus]